MIDGTTLEMLVLAVVGSTGLFGALAYLFVRARREERGALLSGREDVLEALGGVNDRLEGVEERVASLADKVEFTERLLEDGPRTEIGRGNPGEVAGSA